MSAPPILIPHASGTNRDLEAAQAIELAGGDPRIAHVNELRSGAVRFADHAAVLLPGGFSYGDALGAGGRLALELRTWFADELAAVAAAGKPMLGICNGFQVLVRLGLLPCTRGTLDEEVTLTHNLSNHYECRWVTLRTTESRCVYLPAGLTLRWPAAHGQGRLVPRDAELGMLLREEGYAAIRYVDDNGEPTESYPHNPNGSADAIAGLTDRTGRVLGMMPHPDRAFLPTHMPDWRRTQLTARSLPSDGDGMELFRRMISVARAQA